MTLKPSLKLMFKDRSADNLSIHNAELCRCKLSWLLWAVASLGNEKTVAVGHKSIYERNTGVMPASTTSDLLAQVLPCPAKTRRASQNKILVSNLEICGDMWRTQGSSGHPD